MDGFLASSSARPRDRGGSIPSLGAKCGELEASGINAVRLINASAMHDKGWLQMPPAAPIRGCSSMAEPHVANVITQVRFLPSAPSSASPADDGLQKW